MIKIKRIYDPPSPKDGRRILVDRLWPRGIKKNEAMIDEWLKDIAPSNELRKWFSHDPSKWQEFKKRYKNELKDKSSVLDMIIKKEARTRTITLLFAASDTEHNNAVVLKEILEPEKYKLSGV